MDCYQQKRRNFNYTYFNGLKNLTNEEFTYKKGEIVRNCRNLVNTTQKIVKNFDDKSAASLTDYVVPPQYSSNDNSDNRLHIRVGREIKYRF